MNENRAKKAYFADPFVLILKLRFSTLFHVEVFFFYYTKLLRVYLIYLITMAIFFNIIYLLGLNKMI